MQWPARSKTTTPNLNGLSSALSVNIKITATANGDVSTLNADRPTDPAAALVNYTLNKKLQTGPCQLVVTLYSQAGEQGTAVGSISTAAYLSGTGTLYDPDGTVMANLQVTGIVGSVQITIPPSSTAVTTATVGVNQTLQLGYTTEDIQGNPLAVPTSTTDQGGGIFAVQSSATATCSPTGLITGVKAGSTSIQCSVDGKSTTIALTVTPAPIQPQITVGWGALTRATPLTSARSVAVSITDGTTTSTVTADRLSFSANPASYTQTLTGNNKLIVGAVTITVTFYDKTGEQGDVVGTLNATGSMTATGTLNNQSGSALGTVDSNPVITRVVIDPPASVTVGGTEQLTFKCYDANSNLLANVDPGSGTFSSSGSVLSVNPAGVVTAETAGNQNVTCTVDGVASAATSVTVTPGPTKPIVYIGFGAITRASSGLNSARSVKVVVTNNTDSTTTTATVDRDAYSLNNGVAYTNLMSFPSGITVGGVTITCTWYAQTGEAGQVVGNFSVTNATMTNSGDLQNQSGTLFGNSSSTAIDGNPVITNVVVTNASPITVNAGSTLQLTFACYDTNNTQINVDPGSATFTTSGSNLSVTPSGVVSGIVSGSTQNVTCSVDGVATTVTVHVH